MTQRVALVTGGTRGIGAAISLALKAAGHRVAANYASNADAANTFAKEHGIHVYAWDVSKLDDCVAGVRQIERDLGATVGILVNNAGVTRDAAFHKLSEADWDTVINVNLRSCFTM
ncbi:MAG: SDR family NAD(P)-dependent oxidoreductase, partial [Holosporales bacterium]